VARAVVAKEGSLLRDDEAAMVASLGTGADDVDE
jgi:hypothetical protein